MRERRQPPKTLRKTPTDQRTKNSKKKDRSGLYPTSPIKFLNVNLHFSVIFNYIITEMMRFQSHELLVDVQSGRISENNVDNMY